MLRSRTLCIISLILVLLAGQALAGPLGKGIKAGISYSKVTNDNVGDSDHKMGVAAGISISYDLLPGITLQPELLYVQQGGRWDINILDGGSIVGNGELTWQLNYLQVPVLARVNLPVVGAFLPTLIAGPALSIKTASTYETEQDGSLVSSGDLDDIKSTDLSLILGLGFKVGAGPAGFVVDARYNLGSSNLNDTDADVTINNRGFQVLAGFQF
jgi:hypothetical protein